VIHFWLPTAPSEDELLSWDPDLDPTRFASGVGHNIYELFARLRADGMRVTLGPIVPMGVELLVLYAVSIEGLAERKRALAVVRRGHGRYVLIRADAPANFRMPLAPLVDFVPIPSRVRRSNERWLPPLPQRGLVPRSPERFGRILTAAFKGNPENAPAGLRSAAFASALSDRGIELVIDTPSRTDGSDQSWHDFRCVDVVLCLRRADKWRDIDRKPPTKLLNAWSGGCIPLAGREPGYLDIATDGEDAFFVDDPDACLSVIDRLLADSDLLARVERRVVQQSEVYSQNVVLGLWRDALLEAVSISQRAPFRRRGRTALAAAAQLRGALRR
jgi:hypothetical protein